MIFENFIRICVGAPLEVEAAKDLAARFHSSLGFEGSPSVADVYARLRDDAPRHKRSEPDRLRYELAFEKFVDDLWDVDCAIGGVSEGLLDVTRGYVFVGVRVDGFERNIKEEMPARAGRPRWLRKGDVSAGSDLTRELGPDAKKAMDHAAHMYKRATKEVVGDARKRLRPLPVSKQHEPGWALVEWLVAVR